MKISIIIPVYNTKEYLKDCLNSVVNQNYDNLEVIIVNDASTDGSLKICEEYSKNYKFILLNNESNLGLARTRNRGLSCSTGDYILFLDSDDVLINDAVKSLYETIVKEDADVVVAKLNSFNSKGEYGYYSDKYLNEYKVSNIYDNKNLIKCISVCSKIYKSSLIKNIKFLKDTVHEDNSFTLKVYFNSSKIVTLPKYLYYRRIRETKDSIMQNLSYNTFIDLIKNYKEALINIDLKGKEYFLYKYMINQLSNNIVKNVDKTNVKQAKCDVKEFINYIYNLTNDKSIFKKLLLYFNVYGNIVILLKGVIKIVKK